MDFNYLMENDEECLRLELKTDGGIIQRQARWAGLKPGMRVADIGCGPGKTTFFLQQLAGDQVVSVGVDASEERIDYARKHFNGAQFEVRNVWSL